MSLEREREKEREREREKEGKKGKTKDQMERVCKEGWLLYFGAILGESCVLSEEDGQLAAC